MALLAQQQQAAQGGAGAVESADMLYEYFPLSLDDWLVFFSFFWVFAWLFHVYFPLSGSSCFQVSTYPCKATRKDLSADGERYAVR